MRSELLPLNLLLLRLFESANIIIHVSPPCTWPFEVTFKASFEAGAVAEV